MGLVKDLTLLAGILLVAGAVLGPAAGINLPGTQAVKDIFTQPPAQEETRYQLTTNVKVGPEGLKDAAGQPYGFKYKTSKDSDLIFSSVSPFSTFTGAKNVEVEYVLRTNNGRVVATGAKHVGDVGVTNTKDVTFRTGSLKSGTYKVTFLSDFQRCFLGICSSADDKITKSVEVPKLPLGEY